MQACPPTGQGSCSAWATTSFTTQGVPPSPPTPLLDTPDNGATDVSLLPEFAWTAVAEADVYQLLVADNADFDPQRWRVAVAENQHVLPAHQALEAQTLYYWQVASGRLVGSDTTWGAFSSPVWSFTTGTSTEPPGPPTLLLPEDGAVLGPVTSVMLAWIPPAGGAVSYTVEVAQDSVFTQGVRSYPGVEGESFQVMDLVEDRWYWWRVQSCDGGQACSSWSDSVRRFYTGALAVQRYYYVKDHLGSVRATVDEGGVVVHYDDYYPFGAPMPGRGMDEAAPRERYTGHEVEDDLDPDYKATYYAGWRYYDGLIVRWLSIDPLFEKHPDWSPYNYVLANPLILFDPDGRQAHAVGRSFVRKIERAERGEISMDQARREINTLSGIGIVAGASLVGGGSLVRLGMRLLQNPATATAVGDAIVGTAVGLTTDAPIDAGPSSFDDLTRTATQTLRRVGKVSGRVDNAVDALGAISDILRPGGELLGGAGRSEGVRAFTGATAQDAESLFNQIVKAVGGQVKKQSDDLLVVQLDNRAGFITLRTFSTKSGDATKATIDINIPGFEDLRKIKFDE